MQVHHEFAISLCNGVKENVSVAGTARTGLFKCRVLHALDRCLNIGARRASQRSSSAVEGIGKLLEM